MGRSDNRLAPEFAGTRGSGAEFDYSSRTDIDEHTAAIQALADEKRVVDSPVGVVKIGRALHAVHALLGPHRFQAWLADEFDWGQPAASKWMRAASAFAHLADDPCLMLFRKTALYELARGETPAEARDEAIATAQTGVEITLPDAKEIIRRKRKC